MNEIATKGIIIIIIIIIIYNVINRGAVGAFLRDSLYVIVPCIQWFHRKQGTITYHLSK
jgi:hypothetical protein